MFYDIGLSSHPRSLDSNCLIQLAGTQWPWILELLCVGVKVKKIYYLSPMFKSNISFGCLSQTRAQCYKTFFDRDLQIFVIS